jgi:F0F1-type ATP synthase membrane subunit b/b'
MSPTAEIARDLREAATMRLMHRDSYQKYHRNVAEARRRAAKYKEQRTCTR